MTRRLGVDSGSAHLACAILDGDTLPLSYVASRTIAVGKRVPRDMPVTFIDKRGISRTYLDKYQGPTDQDIKSYAIEIVYFALENEVTEAIVEKVRNTHFDGSRSNAGKASQADALRITGEIGITVALELEAAGIKVTRVSHATWAGRVAHSASVKPKQVRSVIGLAITGADGLRNEHERDAAGMCVWGHVIATEGLHAPRKKPAPRGRKAREPKEPRPKPITAARQLRIEMGCKCAERGRHAMSCSMFVPKAGRDEMKLRSNIETKIRQGKLDASYSISGAVPEGKMRRVMRCLKCGEPRKGRVAHDCTAALDGIATLVGAAVAADHGPLASVVLATDETPIVALALPDWETEHDPTWDYDLARPAQS